MGRNDLSKIRSTHRKNATPLEPSVFGPDLGDRRSPKCLPCEARPIWRCPILSRSYELGQQAFPQARRFGHQEAKAHPKARCRCPQDHLRRKQDHKKDLQGYLSLAPRSLDTDLISVPQLLPAHLPSVSLSVPRRIPQRQRSVEQRQRRRLLRRTSKFGWA